jgi:PST family polysaccharide transporter
MKSILKATAVLSSVSVVNILVGLVSAKVNAVLLGPAGIGYMGLLQSLLALTAMFAGMGVGTGLVRAGAQALAADDRRQLAAVRAGAWLLCWTLGGAGVVLLVLFRTPVSRLMLGGAEHGGAVVLVGAALLLTLAAGVQTSVLNAHHRITDLARVGVLNSLVGVPLGLLVIWRWRGAGIAPAVLVGCAVNCAVAYYYMRARTPAQRVALTRQEVWTAARSLLGFGVPFTGSMLVGAGVLTLIPVLVLHALSREAVGYYRAAATISVTYLGFLITAMGQDYYPRAAALSDQPEALVRLVNEQLRFVLLVAGPVILVMLALVPYLVPLVYSPQFVPASNLLEWQLIGDLFKFSSWTMAMIILTRMGSTTFFYTELLGGTLTLATSWFGLRWFGLEGLGISFLLTTMVYFCACLLILRRNLGLRWTTENKLLFLLLVLTTLIVRALPYIGLAWLRTPVALVCAVLFGLSSLYVIWGEVGGLKGLVAWRRAA